MSTLFISYSTKDRPTAELFFDKLIEMGYEKPFRDDHPEAGIPAGSDWERELYRKLRSCKALIVLCSENWLNSKWCFAELAHAKAMGKEFFPVLIDDSANVPSVVSERQTIMLSAPDVWDRLRRGLAAADLAPENVFPWPISGHDECPYPGLSAFEAHHAGVYFGRDDEIQKLRERLNQMASQGKPRLLYVVGASGSGKSSLIKAGLVPRLTKETSHRWCVFPTLRWNDLQATGRDWAEQLAIGLHRALPTKDQEESDWRTQRERYLVSVDIDWEDTEEVAKAAGKAADHFIDDTKDMLAARNRTDTTPLLVIDQFEELMSAADDTAVRAFLGFLGCVMSSTRSPWRCIATVRTDFLPAIQTCAELTGWNDCTDNYTVALMKPERFYEVIRGPAEKVGLAFESDALVDQIVKDTGTRDALPLLAFTMRELYEQFGDDKLFTFDEYRKRLGGLEGCLNQVANELFTSKGLSGEESQRLLLLAFSSHLVRVNEQDEQKGFVRRAAVWSEFAPGVQRLLQPFIDRRLITSRPRDEKDPHSERVIEVAHEALFRTWDKLKKWLRESRDLVRWRGDIEQSRAKYGKKWKGLSSEQLALACKWPKERGEELTAAEIRWIHSAKRKTRRRHAIIGTVAAVIVTLAGIAAVSTYQTQLEQTLREEAEFAEADATLREHDSGLRSEGTTAVFLASVPGRNMESLRTAVRAVGTAEKPPREVVRSIEKLVSRGNFVVRDTPPPEPQEGLVAAVLAVRRSLAIENAESHFTHAEFSPDEASVLTVHESGRVQVWNSMTGELVTTLASGSVIAQHATFSPDAQEIAAVDREGWIKIWDVATGELSRDVEQLDSNDVVSVQYVRKSDPMLMVCTARTVILWSATTLEKVATPVLTGNIESARFDGKLIVVEPNGDGRRITIRDVNDGQDTTLANCPRWLAEAARYTPRAVITAISDGHASQWIQDSGEEDWVVDGEEGKVLAAFVAAGDPRVVVSAANNLYDGALALYDPLTGELIAELPSHSRKVNAISYSRARRHFATMSFDRSVRVWDARSGGLVAELKGHDGDVIQGAFSASGSRLVTTSRSVFANSGTARIWDLGPNQATTTIMPGDRRTTHAKLSPDMTQIVTWSDQFYLAHVWDFEPNVLGRKLPPRERVALRIIHKHGVRDCAFSPDGRLLGTLSGSGKLTLVDTSTLKTEQRIDAHPDQGLFSHLSFAHDSQHVLTVASKDVPRMWDVGSGELVHSFSENGPMNTPWPAAFSRDDRLIGTVDKWSNEACVWDTQGGGLQTKLIGHTGGLMGIDFSPIDERVVTSSLDTTARVWDGQTGQLLHVLEGHRDVIWRAEFSADGRYIITASEDASPRLWDSQTGNEIAHLIGHSDWVVAAHFSPDNRRIATAGQDGTARLWEVPSGKCLGTLLGHTGPLTNSLFSADGKWVLTASNDGTAMVFPATYRGYMKTAAECLRHRHDFEELREFCEPYLD
jgi:WD40 repeat protein